MCIDSQLTHTISKHLCSIQVCKDSAIQCVEYYSPTTTASGVNGDSCKENLVEGSALFSVEIRKPMSLDERKILCKNITNRLNNMPNRNDFWALTSEESCETGGNGKVTMSVWLNRRLHHFVSLLML